MSQASAAKLSFLAQITGEADVSSKVKSMGGAMRQFGTDSETAASKSEKVTGSTTKLIGSMKETTLSFTAAAASLTSLYFQYDNLDKVALRVQKTETSLTSARANLIGAQESLNKLLKAGATSGPEYEKALLRVQTAEEKVQNQSEALRIATGDLSQAQIQFAVTAVPSAISAATSLVSGLKNVNFAALTARLGMIGAGTSAVASGAQFQLTGAMANIGAVGIRNVGMASRIAQLAMGPLGWIMLGIGTVLTLVSTNAFGLRDAIYSVGKAIGDAIPFLRPFLELLGQAGHQMFPEATDSAEQYETQIAGATKATDAFSGSIDTAGGALEETTDQLETYQDWLVRTEKSTISSTTENIHYLESLGTIENVASLTNEQINLTAEYLRDQATEAARSKQENFSLVASYEGLQTTLQLSNDELQKWADGLRLLKQQAEDAGKSIDELNSKTGKGRDIEERARERGWITDKSAVTRRPSGGLSIVTPHAMGGIVNEPTLMMGLSSGNMGIMGEAGPEAIVPLTQRPTSSMSRKDILLKIEIPVIMDGRQIAKVVGDHQVEIIG